jgi:hypothetical protein
MSETRATNPLVEQFRGGAVPKELRLMAAQGALPLKPEDLLELLTDLLADAEQVVADAARRSLAGFVAADLLPVAKSRETAPAVLAWLVANRPEREVREACLQNTSLTDEVIESLAGSLSQDLAELVVINQTRLLRRTSLLVALEGNAGLSSDQKRRLRELRETFHIGETAAAPAPPPPAVPPPPAPVPEVVDTEQQIPEAEEAADGTLSESEAMVRYLTEDERRQTEKVNAVQRIYLLNTAEKVITALKGTREERAILIRDPNKLVATAVLGSPRLTETEVEAFAAMKNVSQDVLRKIGTHRDWQKRYGVVLSLVKNPRTPVAISVNMVSRLNPRDMKAVGVDRNVPEVIRKHAQKFVKAGHTR